MLIQQSKLAGVDPRLVRVVQEVGIGIDVAVLEGLRTQVRQAELFAAGASKTMQSKHLTGRAVDLGVVVGRDVRWDWPLYFKLADAMQDAAKRHEVLVRWGGCWSLLNVDASPEALQDEYVARCRKENRKPFLDGPHFEVVDGPVSA